jgi:hypothetical protein
MLAKKRLSLPRSSASIWLRSARVCAAEAASGASPSSETCCGAISSDNTTCASIACAAVVGCTPSANR